jgi:NAD(P) transhydrogenase subunit beta
MTSMPQLVALFNGFGGSASLLVAAAEFYKGEPLLVFTLTTITLSVLIGAVTFSGSLVAFAKLQGLLRGTPIKFSGQHSINGILAGVVVLLAVYAVLDPAQASNAVLAIIVISLFLGILFVIPIGGADMPVVIAMLNSFSGLAACATGFVIQNNALIISGSLVGASGIILTDIMCKGMNRTIWNVLFAGVGSAAEASPLEVDPMKTVKSYEPEDTVVIFENAKQIVIVPGYGLAVAQAQHMVHELQELLEGKGVIVKLFNLTKTDIGELAMSLVDTATILIGSPTVLVGPHPSAVYAAFLANALRSFDLSAFLPSAFIPAFAPPKGRSAKAFFQVMICASSLTSSIFTSGTSLIPPFPGPSALL